MKFYIVNCLTVFAVDFALVEDKELTKESLLGLLESFTDDDWRKLGVFEVSKAVPGKKPEPKAGDIIEKEGYVWKYTIRLEEDPGRKGNTIDEEQEIYEKQAYFEVIISSQKDIKSNPVEFKLLRTPRSITVDSNIENPWAIRWAPVSMAIIATLKDAFFFKKKVKVTGKLCYHDMFLPPRFNLWVSYNKLETVEITQ